MDPVTGGPCQGIRNIVPPLSRNGISVEVVCLDAPSSEFLQNDSFVIHALGKSITPWKFNPKLYQWLLNHLPDYDLVLVRGLWLYHSYAVTKAIRNLKKRYTKNIPRLYIIPHGMLDPWFQQYKKRKFKAIRNTIYWQMIEKRVVRRADGLLFTCEMELKLAKKTFNGYYPKIELNIGYGIENPPPFSENMKNEFLSKVKGLGNSSYILFLGRLDEKKGVDLLINAYTKLLNSSVKLPKLVIAGPGIDSAYGKKILNIIHANNNIKQHVFFSGMLSGNAKWGALYGCDAFILPSYQENFGIAVVEALACGKPVLISNQVNIHLDISQADAGFTASPTLEGVIDLLLKWFELSSDKKTEMMINSKNLFKKKYTVESAANRLIDLLIF
ncbi:MAG: glycosyltransferase [Ferruginibacter sp.]|nr:glycosyltransferase [Ferruginibacter sp.]